MCDSCPMGDNPLLSKLRSAGTWLSWSHCPQPVESSNRDEKTQRGEAPTLLTKAGILQIPGKHSVGASILSVLAAHKEAQFV